MRTMLIAAGLLTFAAGGSGSTQPQRQAPTWAVDRTASSVTFATRIEGHALKGRFTRWDAKVALDPANLKTAQIAATIDTASATTGDATHDEALPSSDWFASKLHPKATFVSRSVVAAGPGRYVARGELTMRGVKRAVELPFALTIAGDKASAKGTLTLDRTRFGVGQGMFAVGDMVDTQVTVTVDLTARRAA